MPQGSHSRATTSRRRFSCILVVGVNAASHATCQLNNTVLVKDKECSEDVGEHISLRNWSLILCTRVFRHCLILCNNTSSDSDIELIKTDNI